MATSRSASPISRWIELYRASGIVLAFSGGAIGAFLGDKRFALASLALMIASELTMGLTPA